jgi:endonuclease III
MSRPTELHGAKTKRGLPAMPAGMAKLPFDVAAVFSEIRTACAAWPKAALIEIYDLGHTSAFEQAVACMISVRTLDEVTLPTARALFAVARTPAAMAELGADAIRRLIHRSTFSYDKAARIDRIAKYLVAEHGAELPCDPDVIASLPGIGPKCTNLILSIACGVPRIGVDTHVHRVVNRWGYVSAPNPNATLAALEEKLPRRFWNEANRILMPFGKFHCTAAAPRCTTCPVLAYCRQVGVKSHG